MGGLVGGARMRVVGWWVAAACSAGTEATVRRDVEVSREPAVWVTAAPCDTGHSEGWPADADWRVCADGTEAFTDLQPAVDAAAPGDLVAVCPGTYGPVRLSRGKDVEIVAIAGPDETFIDGGDGAAVEVREAALSLRGFSVTGVSVSPNPWEKQGGAFTVVESVVTIADCAVRGVTGEFALFFDEDVLVMEDVSWEDNQSDWLWYLYQGIDVRILGNRVDGGIHHTVAETSLIDDLLLAQSIFQDITVDRALSAFIFRPHAGTLAVTNNVFYGLTDLEPEGGRVFEGEAQFRNNAVVACDAEQLAPFPAAWSAFWANGADYAAVVDGAGNRFEDPLFADPASGDFTLLPGSPLIDAGDPDPTWNDEDGTRNDIGVTGGAY